MAIDFTKLKALADQAAVTENQTVAKTGGGDYTPPAAGPCRVRLVEYIELGKHDEMIMGKKKTQDQVRLVFEVSGPKHPPTVGEDGVSRPARITIRKLNKSLNEKASFFKLFTRMNFTGKAQHMAQLIGEGFKATIVHRTWKDSANKEHIEAELYDKKTQSWTIEPPRTLDEETGEYKPIMVAPMLSEAKVFLWDYADLEQWASIFIDGEYEERKDEAGTVTKPKASKNVIQATIRRAKNFPDSPIYLAIAAAGGSLDIPDAEVPEEAAPPAEEENAPAVPANAPLQGAAATDALNGIA